MMQQCKEVELVAPEKVVQTSDMFDELSDCLRLLRAGDMVTSEKILTQLLIDYGDSLIRPGGHLVRIDQKFTSSAVC